MKRAGVVLLLFCLPCFAADNSYKNVVRAIESHYDVRHHGIPLLGLIVKFVPTEGAGQIKLAFFSHVSDSEESFDDVVSSAMGPDWMPFVRVTSAREQTVIYANAQDKKMRLIIATLENGEASVIHVRLKPEKSRAWFHHPRQHAHHSGQLADY